MIKNEFPNHTRKLAKFAANHTFLSELGVVNHTKKQHGILVAI